jgi:MoaA/NifB/PqqE/SkfB family radical SAM enzyme
MNSITEYLNTAVHDVIRDSLNLSRFNWREAMFLAGFKKSAERAEKLRKSQETVAHIPPFLIASIAKECNLHCAGCYNRQRRDYAKPEMSVQDWQRIFQEARQIGVSFILLAGGEPFMRWEVIEQAAAIPEIVFPVFTNGTMFNKEAFALFSRKRNMLPIISIEGDVSFTDNRRGDGVAAKLEVVSRELKCRHILWGVSITVTDQNYAQVTSDEFLDMLARREARVVIFVEYVPIENGPKATISRETGAALIERVNYLRVNNHKILVIGFPGDEKNMGGCLAAGRGFFHISHWGGAEPCPFSPFSDMSLKDHSLVEALNSRLFVAIRNNGALEEKHAGGCTLFEQKETVSALAENN